MCRSAPAHLYLAIELFPNIYFMKQFYKIHLLVNKKYVEFILIFYNSLSISNKLLHTSFVLVFATLLWYRHLET